MYYLGIDVSKARLDCSLLLDESSSKCKSKKHNNTLAGVKELLEWLTKYEVKPAEVHAVMEGTGIYHQTAAMALHDAGVCVSVVNPAQIKHFGQGLAVRTKTDKKDSWVIARYGALIKPAAWIPPSPEARMLQALLSRREAITEDLQRERNRLEKANAAETPAQIHQSLIDSIAFLQQQLKKLEQDTDDHLRNHPEFQHDIELLKTIPSVGDQVARNMLAIMRSHVFKTAEQLAAYLGVVPIERQSGTSLQGRARLSKTGPARMRAILYMATLTAQRCNPHVKTLYLRLLDRGKSKRSALCAAMRKIVHLCFGVLKSQQSYQAKPITT